MTSEKVVICKPDNQLHMGFVAVWTEMFRELFESRELIWRLFLRDFQAKYKQSLFGVSWAIINPLITVAIFVFLNNSGLLKMGTVNMPYPVFALVGLSVWVIFSNGLTVCSNSILSAGAMVVKINFPKMALVVAAMGQAVVELLVRVGLMLLVFLLYGVMPSKMILLLPVLILPIFFLTLGLGFFLALLTCLFRDTIQLVSLLTTYLMFLMPVAYPPAESGLLKTINYYNPLNHIIVSCREAVLYGSISNMSGYMWSSVFCLVIFLISWRIFHLVETKIAERI